MNVKRTVRVISSDPPSLKLGTPDSQNLYKIINFEEMVSFLDLNDFFDR